MCSSRMSWAWYITILLICSALHTQVEACDEGCQDALIQDFKTLLNPLHSKITQLDSKFENLENTVAEIKMELISMQNTMSNNTIKILHKMDSKNYTVNEKINEIEMKKFESDNLTLSTLVMTNEDKHMDCPEGFFMLSPEGQCLKLFFDQTRTWFEANSKCQNEGLVSAQPSDPVTLQKYIVNKYGSTYEHVWLPARGTGSSKFQWYPNGGYIKRKSPYWHSRPPSITMTTRFCILLATSEYAMETFQGTPYTWAACSRGDFYTVCELVKE